MPPRHAARKSRLAAILLGLAGPAAAGELAVDRITTPWGVATNLRLAAEVAGADTSLQLHIDRLELPDVALRLESLSWRCTMPAATAGDEGAWRCEGPVRAKLDGQSRSGRLALGRGQDATTLALRKDQARATLRLPPQAPAALELRAVPIGWLAPLLEPLLPALELRGGTLRADLVLDAGVAGEWRFDGATLDTPDGALATAALDASGRIAWRMLDASQSLELDATLSAGEWLVAPLYSQLGGRDVALAVRGVRAAGEGWQLREWRFDDAGAVAATGSAGFAPDGSLQSLDAQSVALQLPAAYARYAGSLLAPAGLADLATEGRIDGRVAWREGERWRGRIALQGIAVADARDRFAIEGVDGSIDVREGDPSELRWRAATLYRVPLGGARASFAVDAAGWRLREPVVVPMLGGTLRLDALGHDERAGGTEPWRGSISAQGLNLADLTSALGWPAFGGELSLSVPAFAGDAQRIAIDGAIEAKVFDGRVRIDGLALERPFGVAPSLAADIAMDDLDLELLTGAFSFGSIEGRLDGRVSQLRLVDFSPVAFDAELHTDPAYKGRQRISQRAVANLSSVGGAGAALSSGVARIFDSFPYAAIGLRCRLANNVCRMGGLEPDGDDSATAGYVIVRGSGIPRLTVQGFQRRVDWPVLVRRLQEATSGASSPVVQ